MKPPPNPAPPVDGGIPLQLHIQRAWPSAAQHARWAGGAAAKANQPQRGDMFIAQPNRNLRKPRRGGMVPSRTGHAAPPGLAEKIGGVVVTIIMSLLRSWPKPAQNGVNEIAMFSSPSGCGGLRASVTPHY